MNNKKARLLQKAEAHLEAGENVLGSVEGSYELRRFGTDARRDGILIATDRRLVFFGPKLVGFDLDAFPYSDISRMDEGESMMGATITFVASDMKVAIKWIHDPDLHAFLETLRENVGGVSTRGASQTVTSAPLAAAPQPAPPVDPVAELKTLAELRDLGLLTDEEFESKRKAIVDAL